MKLTEEFTSKQNNFSKIYSLKATVIVAFFYFYPMISGETYQQLKLDTLKHFWGFHQFRDLQEGIVDMVLSGQDALALLPTGGGKSLCYQLPALLQEGTCLVISPLLALMKDQVQQLRQRGIEAAYLSSELEDAEAEIIYSQCKEGLTKLLYVSPERLNNSLFLQQIGEITFSFIAVDEAHCISEWGQDFRPSYQNIKSFREQFRDIPCLALTATATPKVLVEIQEKLGLKNAKIFRKSFKRDNLNIIINKTSDKYSYIENLIAQHYHTGIIYTRTRKETEELTQYLRHRGFNNVDFFHAGLSAKEKNRKQKQWLDSDQHILVSTNAFGMGIDKDNVRFVVHLSPSASVENYYQEIGRAGRDGEQSYVYMLWNEQELTNFDKILSHQIPTKKEFTKMISLLYSMFQVAEGELPEQSFQLRIDLLKKLSQCSGAKIKNVLNYLHNQELIFLNDYKSLSTLELKIHPGEIEQLPSKDAYFLELLLRNLAGLSSGKIHFSEVNLGHKIHIDPLIIKERIRELKSRGVLEYIDGSLASVRFLASRNSLWIENKYWQLFEHIQRNKIQKWEEMKFFTTDVHYCKMKLILSYFGEKNVKNCGQCSVCKQQEVQVFGNMISHNILKVLQEKPSTIEEIVVQLSFHKREEILEHLIDLLDAEKIKMQDFRTYMLA